MAKVFKEMEKRLEVPDALIDEVFKEFTARFDSFKKKFQTLQDNVIKQGFKAAITELGYNGKILSSEERQKIIGSKLYPHSICIIEPRVVSKFLIRVEGNFVEEKIFVTIDVDGDIKESKEYDISSFSSEILTQQILKHF